MQGESLGQSLPLWSRPTERALQRELSGVEVSDDSQVADHRSVQPMLAGESTSPRHCDLGLFCVAPDVEVDSLHQHPHNLLTILRRGGRRNLKRYSPDYFFLG